MANKIRTFIGIDTPPDFKIQAERVIKELDYPGVPFRWEQPYKLHMTLKFIGDTDQSSMKNIESILTMISDSHNPLWLKYDGFGCFPSTRNPRVLWIGCKPLSSDLEHIQDEIETACSGIGITRDNRDFHPHITFGRVKKRAGADSRGVADLIKKLENVTFEPIETEVNSILLMKSELRPSGSVYSILKQFSLSS